VGRVSYYRHHGAWWIYYRDGERPVRRRIGDDEEATEQMAALTNAQLSAGAPTAFSFSPVSVVELRRRFLDHHEHVAGSSLAAVRRYRAYFHAWAERREHRRFAQIRPRVPAADL